MRRRDVLVAGVGTLAAGAAWGAETPSRDDPFVDALQRDTFRWFWETTPADTGLTPDRWPTKTFCSIAAVGFALASYPIGVERGWVTRAEAAERTRRTLRFFADAPQGPQSAGVAGHKGFFYHFLTFDEGHRYKDCELSSIDTTWFIAGALVAAGYFDAPSANEAEIRRLAEELYARVDWPWMSVRPPFVAMGWKPESGFIRSDWRIYDESAFLHFLALGSPTKPIVGNSWTATQAQRERQWGARWGGAPHIQFPPLFGHQYSHMFTDFRGIQDDFIAARGIDYFENSRRATYAQRAYARVNTGAFLGYGEDMFGLSACDGPGGFRLRQCGRTREFHGYSARGPGAVDDGTLAPTALGGSMPFAPEIVVPALKTMKARYGASLYTRHGFLDSFNPTLASMKGEIPHLEAGEIADGAAWIATDHLGIDQGPIVVMIENWRTDLIWRVMRRNEHLRRGLKRAGFRGGWLDA